MTPILVRLAVAQTAAGSFYRLVRIADGVPDQAGFMSETDALAWADDNGRQVVAGPPGWCTPRPGSTPTEAPS